MRFFFLKWKSWRFFFFFWFQGCWIWKTRKNRVSQWLHCETSCMMFVPNSGTLEILWLVSLKEWFVLNNIFFCDLNISPSVHWLVVFHLYSPFFLYAGNKKSRGILQCNYPEFILFGCWLSFTIRHFSDSQFHHSYHANFEILVFLLFSETTILKYFHH